MVKKYQLDLLAIRFITKRMQTNDFYFIIKFIYFP